MTRRNALLLGMAGAALQIAAASAQSLPAPQPGTSVPEKPRANPAAAAAADRETIVVTAERRQSTLQKTALSVTAVSGRDIATHAYSNVAQVLADVPGVQLQSAEGGQSALSVAGGGGPPNISIRGLGTDGPNKSSSTAFYENGVLLLGGGDEFYDVSRVEVLRGPQGTLYGRAATGGAVNVITNDPVQRLEGSAQLQYGSYDYVGAQAVLNVPITDSLAARAGINYIRHDGYLSNGTSNQDDYNTRAKLLYHPSNDFSLLLGGTYYHADGSGAGVEPLTPDAPNVHDWYTPLPGNWSDRIEYKQVYARLNWNLGQVDFTYIPSWQSTHSTDISFGNGAPETVVRQPYDTTFTHEARFSSVAGSPLTWTAGVYYYRNFNESIYSPGSTDPFAAFLNVPQRQAQTSIAGFGDATYSFTNAIRGTVGLRETHDHIQSTDILPFGTFVFDRRYSHFDYKVRLDADVTPTSLAYAMVSTGYRPGGAVNGQAYTNESVTAYEVGSKNRIGNFATINLAGFYYDYSGFQSPESVGFPPTTYVFSVPAKIYGVDLEMAARLTPDDRVTLSPEFLSGHYTGSVYNPAFGEIETNGHRLPHIPKFSISGSYAHTVDLANGAALTGDVTFHYQTRNLTDFDTSNYPTPNPIFEQAAWGVLNTSLTYEAPGGRYGLTLYGKNLTQTIYKLTTGNVGPGAVSTLVSEPRTFGVILRARF